MQVKADVLALAAVLLWSTLAALVLLLKDVPPLLLTGSGLLIGSALSLPISRFRLISAWTIPTKTLALGIFGLFGYHMALFFALRNAPAAEANLINYLWPVAIVLLTPIFLRGFELRLNHVIAAALGFGGSAFAILSAPEAQSDLQSEDWGSRVAGFVAAFAAAMIWATYSVLTKRRPAFDTAAIGLFGLISGVLALVLHLLLERPYSWQQGDLLWLLLLGLGPLGLAFYLWDSAIKLGNPIRIGLMSFLTPLVSTVGVLLVQGRPPTASIGIAALLIVGAGAIGILPQTTNVRNGKSR